MSLTPNQICDEFAVRRAMQENLSLWRDSYGWSMETLARKAGCGKDTIKRIEHGETCPKLSTFYSLCLAFGVGPETLLGSPEDFAVDVKGAA